ncbi:MAG: hypothetical protein K9H61_14355 [Bacteroidia bacterium]|nr:hypothetical protein [Bacteroidia bacterium]
MSQNIVKRRKPIAVLNDEELFLSYANKIFLYSIKTQEEQLLVSLPIRKKDKFLSKFKYTTRLFRIGIQNGIIGFDHLFVSYNNSLYSIHLKDYSIKKEYNFEKGRNPLHYCLINEFPGFTNGIYFGEYYGNPLKNIVRIYRRDTTGKIESVFTFAKGEINHIHNIVIDRYRSCVWILAGDFDNSASIWKTSDDFKSAQLVVRGSQQFRSCMAFPTPQGLLYATDTQFEKNYLRLLVHQNNEWNSQEILSINGSVIYGCSVNENFVFSTSTEPSIHKKNKLINALVREKGVGIVLNESHVLYGNLTKGFKILFTKKKDWLPYRLFQFGTIFFPSGPNSSNLLFSYSIANKTNDLDLEIHRID